MGAWNKDPGRSFTAGSYAFTIDGSDAGWVLSYEGGHATADVVTEKLGADLHARKHLGPVKFEDISITCGTGMSKPFYEWVKTTIDHKLIRKNGSIITADYNKDAVSALEFKEAIITEFGMPALDAAGKDGAKMTVKFSIENSKVVKGSGSKISAKTDASVQKRWLTSNFRLRIDGLDEALPYVNKIEALTIKQKTVDNPQGEFRTYTKVGANLEIPNLVFSVAESHAESLYKWHDEFVIKGNCGQDMEKGGSLEYLTPDLKTVLFTVTFKNLGIFKLTPEKLEAKNEQIRRLKVEMYCEELEFKYDGKACM